MHASASDKWLINLAVLAPLLLIMLGKWRDSLETWYLPIDADGSVFAERSLLEAVAGLPEIGGANNTRTLILIIDKNCPCTQATQMRVAGALQTAGRDDIRLVIIDVNQTSPGNNASNNVISQLPSTPALLALAGKRMLYAGPAVTGNLCTTGASEIPGLATLQLQPDKPVINWLSQGCYCPLKRHT